MTSVTTAVGLYLSTGIVNQLWVQQLTNWSICPGSSQFPGATAYVAKMAAPFFSPSKNTSWAISTPVALRIGAIILLDFLAKIWGTIGAEMSGPGVFQTIYSATVVANAFLAVVFCGRSLTSAQWMTLVVITIGLALTGLDAPKATPASSLDDVNGTDANGVYLMGLFYSLAATLAAGGVNVASAEVLKSRSDAPSADVLSFWSGVFGLLVTFVWFVAYTIPNISSLLLEPMAAAGTSWTTFVFGYLLLTAGNMGRAVGYYGLMGKAGAISTGVTNAAQTVGLFVAGHWMFCTDTATKSCFTPLKAIAGTIVSLGVLAYAHVTRNLPSQSDDRSKKAD